MPKGLSKRQFVELFNSLPEEKKDYALFYTPKGFMTFRKVLALVEKEDKVSRELKDKFIAGIFWEKPSCISNPIGYKVDYMGGSEVVVCSDLTDTEKLGRLVNTYSPTDIEWDFKEELPCQHNPQQKHYKFIRDWTKHLAQKKENEK